ncbi:12068_t:CDS:2 [Gigaspora rosea]|nr:12068_t:CDS:2 [Gigaspora rosea]
MNNTNILETFSNLEADKVDTKKKIPKELLMNLKESLKTEPNRVNTIELNLQITEVNNDEFKVFKDYEKSTEPDLDKEETLQSK